MMSRQFIYGLDGIAQNLLHRGIINRLVKLIDDVVMGVFDRLEQTGKGLGCLLG